MEDFPPTPPNNPNSPDTAAHEFVLSCLEPLSFDRSPPPASTRDFIDCLESHVAPPSTFTGPTLEEYLAWQAHSNMGYLCITLGTCPKRSMPSTTYTALVTHLLAPSSALVPFHTPLATDFSWYSKGKSQVVDYDAALSPPTLVATSLAQFGNASTPGVPRDFKNKGKFLASTMDASPLALVPSLPIGHGLVTKSTIMSPFRDSTLALAIRDIGLASGPPPIIPPTPFLKEVVVQDDFWRSKGKLKLNEVGITATVHGGKKLALSPVIEDYPMVPPQTVDLILLVLKQSKKALTSFKRNQTRLKKQANERQAKALLQADDPFSILLDSRVQKADLQ